MKRILFQGDSITDCDRKRENYYSLGGGYANLVASSLGVDRVGEYEFINRGCSGDRIVDLYGRIKADFTNLCPEYASIYVGVNDVWHDLSKQNGVSTAKFEMVYRLMLDEIFEVCPDIHLILIAPFILEGEVTKNTAEVPDRYSRMKNGVAEKAEVVRKIAQTYCLPCIDLQRAYDEALLKAPATYWSRDGVHPTEAGHEIIKRLWIQTFDDMITVQ